MQWRVRSRQLHALQGDICCSALESSHSLKSQSVVLVSVHSPSREIAQQDIYVIFGTGHKVTLAGDPSQTCNM
jgi:hypothetical protein